MQVRRSLLWTTGVVIAAWLTLVTMRGIQVGASVTATAPYLYAPLAVVLGGWLGWVAGHRVGPRITAAIAGLVATYVGLAALLADDPGRGAIGYANANAALAVQLTALGGLIALHRSTRWHGLAVVVISTGAAFANGSQGATVAGLIVLAAIVTALAVPRIASRWLAALVSLGLIVTGLLTLTELARREVWPEQAIAALTSVRQTMWHVAWDGFRSAPVLGLGPGGYAETNPNASDPDTMSAHSLPLQVGAEVGGAGLAALGLLVLCGLAWALAAHTPTAAWIATAGWTALFVHSLMDHVVEFWPIPLAAGLVLGYGLVAQPSPESQDEVV